MLALQRFHLFVIYLAECNLHTASLMLLAKCFLDAVASLDLTFVSKEVSESEFPI